MSNARNLANLLGAGTTIATASIADDAITSAKLDTNIAVDGSITAGTELVGNVSGRILLDASASGTDVGEEFLLDASASGTDVGGKILFEEGTDDPNTVLNSSDVAIGSNITFLSSTATKFNTTPDGQTMDLLLNATIPSGVSEYRISGDKINGTYDEYKLFYNLFPATDNGDLYARVAIDGTFSAASIYAYSADLQESTSNVSSNGAAFFRLNVGGVGGDGGGGEQCMGVLEMHNVNNVLSPFNYTGTLGHYSTDATFQADNNAGSLIHAQRATVINGWLFYFTSGNLGGGEVKLWGLRS